MSDWNEKVIAEFRENDGKVEAFAKQPLVLLHTTGAKSGQARINPLACLDYEGHLYVFASFAGRDENPAWFHNLKAHPQVTVEKGTEAFAAEAVEVTGAERDRVYAEQAGRNPGFAEYEQKTTRTIPVVELVRS